MEERLRAVELFAGIGGFRLAAERYGVETVWANDVCPEACKVYRDRFGDKEIVEGDVWKFLNEVPAHDLLTAGFPCQPFSSAGKKQGTRDPRGSLFEVIIEVLKARQPRYFVLENVKRLLSMEKGSHFATILDALNELDYKVEWRLLNAMHLGLPQNRQRVIIIGAHRLKNGVGKGNGPLIRLASSNDLQAVLEKHYPVFFDSSRWLPIEKHKTRFPSWGISEDGRFLAFDLDNFSESLPPVKLSSVLELHVDAQFDFTENTIERLKSSVSTNRFVEGVQILYNQNGGARMGYTVFGTEGLAPTLTATPSRHYERYKIGNRYRRLTNVEYARIQGFPDGHCDSVSVYNQYGLYGNAVPPPLVAWVLGKIMKDMRLSLHNERKGQLSLWRTSKSFSN